MTLKFNKIDGIISLFILLALTLIIIFTNNIALNSNSGVLFVKINIDGQTKFSYRLDEDRVITLNQNDYPSLLGEMIIEINDNRVRVLKEESPLNYCSKQGWVTQTLRPIVCLPNGVYIVIEGENINDNDVVLPS